MIGYIFGGLFSAVVFFLFKKKKNNLNGVGKITNKKIADFEKKNPEIKPLKTDILKELNRFKESK